MDTQMTQEPTVTVNGKTYQVNALPPELRDMLAVYQLWETELATARREVFKTEAAIRALTGELEGRFKALEDAAAAMVAATAETQGSE